MRPHSLRLTAFGPFASTVHLDLDAISEQGLFLLHGATGAGKTSLLDAICFAIFGQLPGSRQAEDVRCRYAPPEVATRVVLEATVRGRRLRWTRAPRWQRPRRRGGAGTTSEQPKVLVEEWLAGRWQALTTSLQEAGLIAGDAVGLTPQQFFRVVLLPQGQFAEFLHCSSTDRERVLASLFDTTTFDHVTEWLKDERARTQADRDAAAERVALLVARVAEAAGVDVPAGDPLPWALRHLEAAQGSTVHLQGEISTAAASASDSVRDHRIATDLVERHRRRGELGEQQAQLAAREAGIDQARQRLALAERAVPPALAAQAAAEAAAAALDAAEHSRAVEQELPGEHRGADLRALAAVQQAEAGRLGVLREQWADLQAHAEALRTDSHGVLALRATADATTSLAAAGPSRRAALQSALRGTVRLRDLARALEARRTLTVAQAHRDEARAAFLDARDARQVAKDHEQTLRQVWLDQAAGRLALQLAVGEACCVCGSIEHPQPATHGSHSVTELQIQAAAQRTEELDVAQDLMQAVLATAEAELKAASRTAAEVAGPDLPDETTISRAADAITVEVAERLDEAGVPEATETALADLDEEISRLQDEAEAARSTAADLETSLRVRAESLAVAAARFDGDPTDALAAALALTALATRAADLQSIAEAAQARAEVLAGDAERAALDAGFTAVAHALQASLTDAERAELTGLVRHHEERSTLLQGALAELGDVPAGVPSEAEVAALAVVAAQATAREAALRAEHGAVAEIAGKLTRRVPELATAIAAEVPLAAAHDEVANLAELAQGRGSNALRMSLTTFVLAARLEEVCAAASGRLAHMTDGRYRLVHDDGVADKRSRHGLGLMVDDAWTGGTRPASGLSGGETFLASLALALGLADVVTAEAGATQLDALFVDEGFGSLDPESLDRAMEVLDGLRSGGRSVGVVSHVAELRERIGTRVLVTRSRSGSSIDVTHGSPVLV